MSSLTYLPQVGRLQNEGDHKRCFGALSLKSCSSREKHMVVDLNSFVSKRPFFANKKVTFANLSRIVSPCSFHFSSRRIAAFKCQRCKRNDDFPTPAVKSQLFIKGVAHDMRRLESRSFSFAVQLQLEVAAFQYQASILTRSGLRLYLPLQSKPALSRGLSRIFRGTVAKNHPRFRAESHRLTPTETHT